MGNIIDRIVWLFEKKKYTFLIVLKIDKIDTGDEDNIVVCDDFLRPGAGPQRPTGQPELVIPPSPHQIWNNTMIIS